MGIVPDYRGSGVFSQLFEFNCERLKNQGIRRYYLEVLQDNDRAISAYRNKGFKVTREYKVLKSPSTLLDFEGEEVKFIGYEEFLKLDISRCEYIKPCFEHCTSVLKKNSDLFSTLYVVASEEIVGFCIYDKVKGSIVGMGFEEIEDLAGVVRCLMSKYTDIVVKNLDMTYISVISMFESLGFMEIAKQFEMAKDI